MVSPAATVRPRTSPRPAFQDQLMDRLAALTGVALSRALASSRPLHRGDAGAVAEMAARRIAFVSA